VTAISISKVALSKSCVQIVVKPHTAHYTVAGLVGSYSQCGVSGIRLGQKPGAAAAEGDLGHPKKFL